MEASSAAIFDIQGDGYRRARRGELRGGSRRLARPRRPAPAGIFAIGLLPLANAPIIGISRLVLRYRISLRRRSRDERVGITPGFAVASALALTVWISACVFAPEGVMRYLEIALGPVDVFFRSLGFQDTDYSSRFFQFIPMPLLLGATMSGPPLLLALIFGWLCSRYQVVVIPRGSPPGPA